MSKKPIYYSQVDPKWKDKMYSAIGDPSQTIGRTGCGPTAAAMVAATFLKDPKITPVGLAAFSVSHGHRTKDNGTSFSLFEDVGKEFGFDVIYTWDFNKALQAIKDGFLVIGRAKKGLWTSGGHFILWYGIEAERRPNGQQWVLINDPNSTAPNKSRAPIEIFKAQVTPFFICKSKGAMSVLEQVESLMEILSKKIQITDKSTLKRELIDNHNSSMWWVIKRLLSEYPEKNPIGKSLYHEIESVIPIGDPPALKAELDRLDNSSMWWVIDKLLDARR